MHLDPERSARQTPSRICRHHGYIGTAGKIAPVIMKLRPLLQIQWPAPPPPRAGRTARRFGAPLTPRLARRPLCGEPLLPQTFRRRVAGVPPVRRCALRFNSRFSVSIFKLYQIVAPLENKGVEAVKYTKVVHFSE